MDRPVVSHEDTSESRDYWFTDDGVSYVGHEVKTYCGRWICACDDDPGRRVVGQWRWDVPGDEVTCPACLAIIAADAAEWEE